MKVLARIFKIRVWFDWDRMKSFTVFLLDGFKKLFVPQKETGGESFTLAQQKYNLTDADLLIKQNALLRLSIIMVTVACLIFIYAIYHFFYGTFKAGMVSIIITMIALVLAFRYHFWYFQIKSRKLGCTLREWYKKGLLGETE